MGKSEDENGELLGENEDQDNVGAKSVERCGKCRRLKLGHPKPYGREKCELEELDETELAKDDAVKTGAREKQFDSSGNRDKDKDSRKETIDRKNSSENKKADEKEDNNDKERSWNETNHGEKSQTNQHRRNYERKQRNTEYGNGGRHDEEYDRN